MRDMIGGHLIYIKLHNFTKNLKTILNKVRSIISIIQFGFSHKAPVLRGFNLSLSTCGKGGKVFWVGFLPSPALFPPSPTKEGFE